MRDTTIELDELISDLGKEKEYNSEVANLYSIKILSQLYRISDSCEEKLNNTYKILDLLTKVVDKPVTTTKHRILNEGE